MVSGCTRVVVETPNIQEKDNWGCSNVRPQLNTDQIANLIYLEYDEYYNNLDKSIKLFLSSERIKNIFIYTVYQEIYITRS